MNSQPKTQPIDAVYAEESARIRADFEATGDGLAALAARSGFTSDPRLIEGEFMKGIYGLTGCNQISTCSDSSNKRITGGVLGAMETGYQRGRIQDESMHYEMLKHTGEYPIIGVNTFRNPNGDPVPEALELARSTDEIRQVSELLAAVWGTSPTASPGPRTPRRRSRPAPMR